MYVENTLFQSESWQRHAILARSLPPLISYPYTDHELKLFRSIVEWHLASFHFKTILPSDCLIRFDDLLDFYNTLRKLRDTISTTSFNRPLPPPPPPLVLPMGPPKQRTPSLAQSFELPTMGGNSAVKSHLHHRHSTSTKIYPPTIPHSHPPNYLLQQNADLLASFSNPSSPSFHFNSTASKANVPVLPSSTQVNEKQNEVFSSFACSLFQWNENHPKVTDKIRSPLPRPMIPMSNSSLPQDLVMRDKRLLAQKPSQPSISNNTIPRETKESGWVQINNVFVPYIVKLKTRDNELGRSFR